MSRLAVDVGGSYLRYELLGEGGYTGKLSAAKGASFEDFLEKMLERERDIEAVAVSFAGFVSGGRIVSAPNIELEREDIVSYVMERFGVKMLVENDLNCAALAEAKYWDSDFVVALYPGTGIGCGVVHGGTIVKGSGGFAMEIGHIPYRRAPFACGCGKDNCLELYASGSGMKRWMEYHGCDGKPDLKSFAESSNQKCREIYDNFIEALLYACACAITLCNPQKLILGGGVMESNPELLSIVRERIGDYALAVSLENIDIELTALKNAPLEGAKILLDTI